MFPAIAAGWLLAGCADRDQAAALAVDEIRRSHVEANEPNAAEFRSLLTRDLEAYLQTRSGKRLKVEFDFLRDGPTQSGMSFPKYYVWLRATQDGKPVEQGAARVAAIEQKAFNVTDYVTREQIKSGKVDITSIFPAALLDKIRAQANKQP